MLLDDLFEAAFNKFSIANYSSVRVRLGFGKFSKVMEIKMPFSKDLESLEKRRFLKMAIEKFFIFVWKNSNHILKLT